MPILLRRNAPYGEAPLSRMIDSIFQNAILGGGWAMFLLIPASVVAVATTLRGLALLFGSNAQKNPAALAAMGHSLLQPLSMIIMLAPMIGAIAAAWRMAAGYLNADVIPTDLSRIILSAFIPLAWGVTVGLIATLGYAILRGRLQRLDLTAPAPDTNAPHPPAANELQKSRWPSASPAFIAIIIAAALCGTAMFQLQTDAIPALPNITLAPPSASPTLTVQAAPGTTILEVNADAFLLNDQPVTDSDLLFRLTALASKSPVIIIKPASEELPASRLTDALLLVNQAGFTEIGIQ